MACGSTCNVISAVTMTVVGAPKIKEMPAGTTPDATKPTPAEITAALEKRFKEIMEGSCQGPESAKTRCACKATGAAAEKIDRSLEPPTSFTLDFPAGSADDYSHWRVDGRYTVVYTATPGSCEPVKVYR